MGGLGVVEHQGLPKYGRIKLRTFAVAVGLCLAFVVPRSVATHLPRWLPFSVFGVHDTARSIDAPKQQTHAAALQHPTEIHVADLDSDNVSRNATGNFHRFWAESDPELAGFPDHLLGDLGVWRRTDGLGLSFLNRSFSEAIGGRAMTPPDGRPLSRVGVVSTSVGRMLTVPAQRNAFENVITTAAMEGELIPESDVLASNIFDPKDGGLPLTDRLVGGGDNELTVTELNQTIDGDDRNLSNLARNETSIVVTVEDLISLNEDGQANFDSGNSDGGNFDSVALDRGNLDRGNFDNGELQLTIHDSQRDAPINGSTSDLGEGRLNGAVSDGGSSIVPEPCAVLVWSVLVALGVAAKWLCK